MSNVSVPKRALILGGGGAVGIAWEIGLLAGLREAGLDVAAADVIIGTSAGSVVGSRIAHGADPREMLASLREPAERPEPATAQARDVQATEAFGIWGSGEDMTQARRAAVGAVALRANTASEADYLTMFAAQSTAVMSSGVSGQSAGACEDGALRVFDAASGVPLRLAISASCSVPTLFPPVTIEGRRYTDGGVRSGTSADLALPHTPDVALIVAALGAGDRGIHQVCRRQAEDERAQLVAAGVAVTVIFMDDASMAAGGANFMDASTRGPAAEAGCAQGRRIAATLTPAWNVLGARSAAPS
jgi:NTE family protein